MRIGSAWAGQRTPELDVVGTVTFHTATPPAGSTDLSILTILTIDVNEVRSNRPMGVSGPLKLQMICTVEKTGPVRDGEALAGTVAFNADIGSLPATVNGRAGAPFSLVFQAENVRDGFVATATGLPKGLTLSRDTVSTARSRFTDPFVISGATTQSGAFPVTVAVTGPDGVNGSGTTTLQISDKKTNAAPNVIDAQALPDRTAAGNRITFVADATDPENSLLSYSWSFGDGGTALGQQVFHTYTNPGAYTVSVSAADGALTTTQTLSVEITGTPSLRPVVDFASATPNPVAPRTDVTFNAIASDPQGQPLTLRWSFGDGTPPVTGNPVVHAFAQAGDFQISVTAINTDGLSTTFSDLAVFAQNATEPLNIDSGDVRPSAENLQTEVFPSRSAVIALKLSNFASAQERADTKFLTVFRLPGRNASAYRRGNLPINRLQRSGVALAASRSTPALESELSRRSNKHVPISSLETAEKGPEDDGKAVAASRRTLNVENLSGKFTFGSDNTDSVKVGATFEIPNAVDVTVEQEF